MRWMLAVAAAFVLAGCGSGAPGQAGAPITPDRPAPPIVAADETPPDDIQWFLNMDFKPDDVSPSTDAQAGTGFAELCSRASPTDGSSTVTAECPQPSPDDVAKMQAEDKQYRQAIGPAAGSEPKVVAKLELGQGQELFFTEWTASTGAACWDVEGEGPDGGGGGGPSGPCTEAAQHLAHPDNPGDVAQDLPTCNALCLESDPAGTNDPAKEDFRLEGTVPADAEALRVTVAGGATATYPLVGPRLSDQSLRVFMVDLGNEDWRKLELIRKGSVASTATMPAFQVAYEDCQAQVGPFPAFSSTTNGGDDLTTMRSLMDSYSTALDGCLKTKGF